MVHCYKNNGYNIVLDSNSGSVHAVDEVAFEVIDKYESRSKEEIILELCAKYPEITADDIEEIFQDIEELKKEGKLFSERMRRNGLEDNLKTLINCQLTALLFEILKLSFS